MNVVGTIARVPAPSRREFEERYVTPEIPVILTGSIEHWPARRRWTAEELKTRIGHLPTRFKVSRSHRHPDFNAPTLGDMFATQSGSFSEFLGAVTTADGVHCIMTGEEEFLIRNRPPSAREENAKLAPLLEDFEVPPYFSAERLYSSWFWLSRAGVRTWLHYDTNGCHNLNAQVQGRKKVWLIPPDALARTYPFVFGGSNPATNCCQVNLEEPDLARFPAFSGVECWTGELFAGDLLFLPANWIHSFLHTGEFNSNVNFWWKPDHVRHTPVSARQEFLIHAGALHAGKTLSADTLATLSSIDRAFISSGTAEDQVAR